MVQSIVVQRLAHAALPNLLWFGLGSSYSILALRWSSVYFSYDYDDHKGLVGHA